MYRPRSIPNSSPSGAKGVYGHMFQTPVTPNQRQMRVWHLAGFKRLLDTVFYIPVVPLVLRCDLPKPRGGERCIRRTKLTLMGAIRNHTIGVNLAVSNYDRCDFITAPFCINISNNAQDENISVRSRAIHCASFL